MTIHSYIDGSWKTVNSVYAYNNGSWRQITSGWAYIDGSWRNFFTSGTFTPTLRNPTTLEIFTARSVGLAVQLYRGSNTVGSYAYQFQYAIGLGAAYTNETGAGASGTLTGTTYTANYTTDVSYVGALEDISTSSADDSGITNDIDSYRNQEAKRGYIRARVIESGETQFSNIVRVQKRQPINISTTISLTRLSTGVTYVLTEGNNRSPLPGDTLFWTPNFQNTTTLLNDTRPDYYWFNFSGGLDTNKNSIQLDPANPRNPINARRYVVQNSDVGAQIVTNLRAINSNTATADLSFATLEVTDGTLLAPQNLSISYLSGQIRTQWEASAGGNDNFKNYSVSIERDGVVVYTSPTTQVATFYNYTTSIAGVYRFRVTVSQTGSVTVTSLYSNEYTLAAPAAFSVTVQNVSTLDLYKPTVFTVNAPTLSASELNLWTWTWGTSTVTGPAYAKVGSFNTISVATWDSYIQRPNGTIQNNASDRTSASDFWSIQQSGNHTQNVEARNKVKNYVRISWTRPPGTSAVSYSLYVSGYFPGSPNVPDWNRTINVEDVGFVDIEQDYFAGGTNYGNSSRIRLNSIYAFAEPNQQGSSVLGTALPFNFNGADGTTDWSNCNQFGVRSASRTDNLTLEAPVLGTLTTTGIFEPGQTLSLAEGSGWSPAYANWTKTSYNWLKSVTIQPATAGTASTQVIANNNTAVGSEFFCEVVVSYKGTVGTVYSSIANIVPGPPSYSLTDLFNQRFTVSSAAANGGTFYYGTYSGSSNGSITETAIASTFTSPTVSPGTINTTLFSRRYVTQVYPNTVNNIQVNSTRSTSSSIGIAVPPQSTGSRRYISNAPSISAGNDVYISTNGYYGNASMPNNNYFNTIPTPGGFLNIAGRDLILVYCYTLVDAGGVWIRYRGEEYPGSNGRFLEYQVYNTFSGTSYILFIDNSLSTYVVNTAYTINGSIQNFWNGSASDTSNFTLNQGTSGWTSRTVRAGGTVDDGVIQFTVTLPAVSMNPSPTVTRTAGGFTFNITDTSTGTFDFFATYGSSVVSGTATVNINSSTGLVTVTGMASSSFATVRISKTRGGYATPPTIDVQGQALAGAAPQLVIAPSFSTSGPVESGQSVNRAQIGAVLTRQTGSYNNQLSKNTALVTIFSVNYTGQDSNWTASSDQGATVTISTSAATASANIYRVRDRVVGTDGSTVDFYSPTIYRAVFAPPPGGFSTPTQTSVGINYTGGSGAPRYYRYQNGSELNFLTDSGAGPFFTNFTGLTANTTYNIQLFGGNTEGYLSLGFIGGNITTAAAAVAPTNISQPTLSGGTVVGNTLTFGVGSWSGSPTSYQLRLYRGTAGVITSETLISNAGNTTSSTYVITQADFNSGQRHFRAFATATNAGGTSNGGTFTPGVEVGPITAPVVANPAITSGPGISWGSGNNFTLSATASNATNIEFEVQFGNNNGGPVLSTQTFFMGASAGSRTTGAQQYSWARTRAKANNTTTGLSSSFTGFTSWA